MISKDTFIRPGMTAIAAVIALSSTPLFAQEAAPQTTAPSTVPTQVAPPAVFPTSPSTAVPTTVTPPAAATVAPQPVTPVIELAPPAPTTPAPVEAAPDVAEGASARPGRAETPRPAASQRNAAPAPAAPAPVEAQPVAPPAAVEATPAPLAVEATFVEQAPPAVAAVTSNDTLPLVGAGALAVLALGAAGFALSRRRRRDDVFADETIAAEPMMAVPVAPPAPAFARAVEPTAVAAPAAAATLPNGFDISRHGRHVQAAYRGPTPDNPFVSLKKRLTRAHFYDMQEARAAEAGAMPQTRPAAPRPAQDRFEVRSPAKGNARTGGFRPAYQH